MGELSPKIAKTTARNLIMNSIAFLVQICPPPTSIDSKFSLPSMFEKFNLSCDPPRDLIDLYACYGTGTFRCATEDLDLLDPYDSGVTELRYIWENSGESMADYPAVLEPYSSAKSLPENVILWGHTGNGVLLASVKLDPLKDWLTMVIGNPDINSCIHFRSGVQFLAEYLSGSLHQSLLAVWSGDTTYKSDNP